MLDFNRRAILFLILTGLAAGMAFFPLSELLRSGVRREYYSHIPFIPLISLFFLYQKRKEIISYPQDGRSQGWRSGVVLLALGLILFASVTPLKEPLTPNDKTTLLVLSAVIFLAGAFLFCFGPQAFRLAIFPISFLLFTVPIPGRLMDGIIYSLQVGSTEFTHLLFMVTGIPFVREEFVFHLPGISIEVAKQCSGIRSTLALVITSFIAGELFLKTRWKKFVLVLFVFPITVFKNALRISVLSILGVYVDPRILGSELHRSGGIPFFGLALLLMAPILFLLMRGEKKK